MKKLLTLALTLLLVCSMFVACGDNTNYDLDGAVAYVEGLYKEDLSVTAVDYTVASQVIVAGVTYQVEWSVDTDKVTVGKAENGVVAIGVDEKSPEEVAYKLTATVKAGKKASKTTTFSLTVPKYSVNSHEEYMAAEKDAMLTVEGIVVAINSMDAGNKYNHLFLADAEGKGGYYCYSVSQDPVKDLGIAVGMTVKVTGPMAPYSGMQEIKGGQVAIVDSTIKTVEPVDITEKFAAGENLGVYVGMPVVIKGATVGAQDLEKDTSQYLYFSIGEEKGYVRTYITDFPTTLKAEEKAAIDADHAAHFGYKADATGILVLYNGAPYLIPMSATPFTNYEEVILTAEEKIAAEFDELKITTSFSNDEVVDILSAGKYYSDVAFAWTTDDETGAVTIADGKLNIVAPNDKISVKVTVTATCGDATDSKTFTLQISKTPVSIPEALEIADGASVLVAGTVTDPGEWSDKYGNTNATIADAEGNTLDLFRLATKVEKGDYIIVTGKMGSYNGARQVAAGATATIVSYVGVEDALALPDGESVVVKGTVSVAGEWSDKYGNMNATITDESGKTLDAYRLATKVAAGDVVIITGKMGSYNGARQVAAGATAAILAAE